MRKGAFGRDEKAVAAALATALLVGVVVAVGVAATVIFKRVANSDQEVTMSVQFVFDDGSDRLTVATAGSGDTWSRLGLRLEHITSSGFGFCVGNSADATPMVFHDEAAGGPCLSGPNRMTVPGRETVPVDTSTAHIFANSFLEFCGEQPVASGRLRVIDLGAGATLTTISFGAVEPCNG